MADDDQKNAQKILDDIAKKLENVGKKQQSIFDDLSKSASDLGRQMYGLVDPTTLFEKALKKIKNESDNIEKTIEIQREHYRAIPQKIEELGLLKQKNELRIAKLQRLQLQMDGEADRLRQQKIKSLRDEIPQLDAKKARLKEIQKLGENEFVEQLDKKLTLLGRISNFLKIISSGYSTMISLAEDYDKLLSDTAKAQGTTKDEIDSQYKAIQRVNTGLKSNLASNQEILAGVTSIRKEYALTTSQLANIGKESANISRLTGLSVDEAVKFQTTLAEVGNTSVQAQASMTVIAAKAAEAAGVPMGQVMRDVANASSAVRTIFKGNTDELVKQAAEARKLGTNLDAAAKSAEALLNFESSIGAEMKASALLGQSLNFNESRRLAFAGDLIGAEKALQREIEKVGDLDKLNYNQRKALAEVTGKDFGELQRIQTQKKNLLEAERMFPKEAEKMRKAQQELNDLQKKGPEQRKKELELLIKQKTAEAELQKLTQAKQEALNNIGKLLQPIYTFIMSIQTAFFKFISLITNFENSFAKWAASGVAGLATLVAAFFTAKFGISKALSWIGRAAGEAAAATGEGIGKGLTGVSRGLMRLSVAINKFSFSAVAKISILMIAMAGAAWGVSKALENLGTVGVDQILAFTVGMSVMIVALGALAFLAGPIGLLSLALMGMALAALGVGGALKMAAPAIDSIGKTLTTLATIVGGVIMKAFDTMLGLFTALPDVIKGVAVGLTMIANIGFLKLTRAAAGVAAMSSEIYNLGKNLLTFPIDQFTKITTQIDALSNSAQGLQYAVDSLKQLFGIKLPTIEVTGLETLSSTIQNIGKNLLTFPIDQLSSITTQIDALSNSAQGLQYAVDSLKQLSDIKLPTLEFSGLSALSALDNTTRKQEAKDLKAGFEALADKFDRFIDMLASGGIAVNLDGTKVNHALAKSINQRGAYGQTTVR